MFTMGLFSESLLGACSLLLRGSLGGKGVIMPRGKWRSKHRKKALEEWAISQQTFSIMVQLGELTDEEFSHVVAKFPSVYAWANHPRAKRLGNRGRSVLLKILTNRNPERAWPRNLGPDKFSLVVPEAMEKKVFIETLGRVSPNVCLKFYVLPSFPYKVFTFMFKV
jgi:hypothetical protein